jgi:hypothetical protein
MHQFSGQVQNLASGISTDHPASNANYTLTELWFYFVGMERKFNISAELQDWIQEKL